MSVIASVILAFATACPVADASRTPVATSTKANAWLPVLELEVQVVLVVDEHAAPSGRACAWTRMLFAQLEVGVADKMPAAALANMTAKVRCRTMFGTDFMVAPHSQLTEAKSMVRW